MSGFSQRTRGRERMSTLVGESPRREGWEFLAYNSIMEIEGLLKSRKEQILDIARKNGAYDVRVFGSVARGEARPDSDIDFLVNLEAGRSLLDLARLLRELKTMLGVNVDVVTEAGLRARIRSQVLKEARPL
jgi:predicted nucleotidyltransferase